MLSCKEVPAINSERWLSLEDFEDEEWRDIGCCIGSYQISNYGRVKSVGRFRKNNHSVMYVKEKIRRLNFTQKGYPCIRLSVNCNIVCQSSIHRLVAMEFIPNTELKEQVDHINTIKTDNRVLNLRWVTNKENAYNPITAQKVHEKNSVKGRFHHSEETKVKLSEQKTGEKNPMYGRRGYKHPRARPVVQISLNGIYIKEWSCAREASQIYGKKINACCRGKRNTCGGYKWIYKEDFKIDN